jgi:hypothetical protein
MESVSSEQPSESKDHLWMMQSTVQTEEATVFLILCGQEGRRWFDPHFSQMV